MSEGVAYLGRQERLNLVRERVPCWACGRAVPRTEARRVALVPEVEADEARVTLCPACRPHLPPLGSLADAALWRDAVRRYGAVSAMAAD